MKTVRRQRLYIIIFIVVGVGVTALLAFQALKENLNLYYSPTDIVSGKAPLQTTIRGGGLVLQNSLRRSENSLAVNFDITDSAKVVTVQYTGILPDLFKEGQGVVVLGKLRPDGIFYASEVLAKHDSTYMPPEVQMAIDKAHGSQDKDAS